VVVVFVLCVVCCIIGHVAILYSVVSTRTSQENTPPEVPRPRLAIEIVWALIPAIVLAFLLTATWTRVRSNDAAKPGVLMKVAR
jgi:heme/copper-type cytochrome/quinol oxidase subunit 2